MSSVLLKVINKNRAVGKCVENVSQALKRSSSTGLVLKNGNILCSDIPDVEIPRISVTELIYPTVDKWPNHVAVECALTGRKYTFSDVREKCRNLSKALRKKLKLAPNDVIAILLPNVPEFCIAALGSIEAGLIVTSINPVYTPDEIKRQLEDSATKAIITLNEFHQKVTSALVLMKKDIPVITIKTQPGEPTPSGAINFNQLTDNVIDIPDFAPVDSNELAFLPYSSGTTGLPKGVELTHSNIVANLIQFSQPSINVCYPTTVDHQDVIPAVLPHFHIYGLTINLLHTLHIGAKTVSLPKFSPDIYMNMLKQHKPDVLFVVPPIILYLASSPAVKSEDLESVRTIVSGAAPLGALDEERMYKKANRNLNIIQGFGLTETSPVIALLTPRQAQKKKLSGTVGKLVPNTQVKIIDLDKPGNEPLGPNQVGEVLVKGPQVMRGYHNRPQENQNSFLDGWFRTGDVCKYDDEGFLYITDRYKELIKVKGFQVPPAELEEILRDHPEVGDAAVIGVPHEKYGEVPRAYVVPKANKTLDIKNLTEFVNDKIAEYKRIIGGICVIENIPKTQSGKILKKELKSLYEKEQNK